MNGVFERMNRTLMEKARCMVHNSNMTKSMWGGAVLCATYLTNRSPCRYLNENKTPVELWQGKKPDISKLKVFGTVAHVHIPKELRSKLDSKSNKCYMVGYSSSGYRLWDTEKRSVIIARDVVFDEFSTRHISHFRTDIHSSEVQLDKPVDVRSNEPDITSPTDPDHEEHEVNPDHEQEVDPDHEEHEVEPDHEEHEVEPPCRSERTRREPAWMNDYSHLALCGVNFVESCYEGALSNNNSSQWVKAMERELKSIENNCTYLGYCRKT